ncbi:MAG: hypothetical protein JSS75_13385 [Bacteroidetes bacterium]|nr:hypothetical protein [Bacteroidota bacterium]
MFTVGANETWEFEIVGYLSISSNGILGASVTTSGGINLSSAVSDAGFIFENLNVSALGVLGVGMEGARTQDASAVGDHVNTTVNLNISVLGAQVSNTFVKMKGFVHVGSSATTVTARWQQVIGAGLGSSVTLNIQPNSYLKATRVE